MYGPKERQAKRLQRAAARRAGLCGVCGYGKPAEGKKSCENCLQTGRDRYHRYMEAVRIAREAGLL